MQTKPNYKITDETLTVDTKHLCEILCTGRANAVKIGTLANARLQVGKSVLWNLEKIRTFIDSVSV